MALMILKTLLCLMCEYINLSGTRKTCFIYDWTSAVHWGDI